MDFKGSEKYTIEQHLKEELHNNNLFEQVYESLNPESLTPG